MTGDGVSHCASPPPTRPLRHGPFYHAPTFALGSSGITISVQGSSGVKTMSVQNITQKVASIYRQLRDLLEGYAAPVFDLAVRIWIGLVFFRSGLEKAKDWDATVFLFKEEYQLPILPPEIAAALGMTTEFCMPIFLILGLAARLAAMPLIIMTCVIQFVLGAAMPAYDSPEHFYWLFLLCAIVVRGPGLLSLDHFIAKRLAA
jgi:putative oxidoreductase